MAASTASGTTTKRTRKAKKDPNRPKRPLSSYMFFAKDMREQILKDRPELRTEIGKVGQMIGEKWSQLPNDKKAIYDQTAAGDRIRYHREMSQYKKTQVQ